MAKKHNGRIKRVLFLDRLLIVLQGLQVEYQISRKHFLNQNLIYRQALAESTPPCIPYIGLILQDLTFVQIGNQDFLEEKINFAKRWQQFNILVS